MPTSDIFQVRCNNQQEASCLLGVLGVLGYTHGIFHLDTLLGWVADVPDWSTVVLVVKPRDKSVVGNHDIDTGYRLVSIEQFLEGYGGRYNDE